MVLGYRKKGILLLIAVLSSRLVASQDIIRGRVLDQANLAPLDSVRVSYGFEQTFTNSRGEFEIPVSAKDQVLLSQASGYASVLLASPQPEQLILMNQSNLELDEVIVSASTSHAVKAKSGTLTVGLLSQKEIAATDRINLANSLNRIPGVFMQSGALNTNRITIRGMGSRTQFGTNRIRAYYDQIPLTDGNNNTTIEDIDFNTIGRIEILKGPNASLYGSGLGGVILILPDQPPFETTSLSSSIQIGSFGTSLWNSRAGHHTESLSAGFHHSKIQSDGYRDNNQYFKETYTINGRVKLNKNSHLTILANHIYLKSFIPSSLSEEDYLQNPESAAFTWRSAQGFEAYNHGRVGLGLTTFLKQSLTLSSSFFLSQRGNYEPRPFNILDEETTGIGTRTVLRKEYATWQFSLGTELYFDRYDWQTFDNLYEANGEGSVMGPLLSDQTAKRAYQNYFGEVSWSPSSRMRVQAGLNLNRTTLDWEDQITSINDNHTYQSILSPKIGASYTLPRITLFANMSRGFSTPDEGELLLPSGQLNSEIMPEVGWNFEIGKRLSLAPLNLKTSFYWLEVTDLLVSRRVTEDESISINAGGSRHIGLESEVDYLIWENELNRLAAFANINLNSHRFVEFVDEGDDHSDRKIPGIPGAMASFGLNYTWHEMDIQMDNLYVGEMPLNDENSLYAESYQVTNLNVQYTLNHKRLALSLYGGVQNIFDEHYASMVLVNAVGFGGNAPRYYYPGLPRNYYSGLKLKYLLSNTPTL